MPDKVIFSRNSFLPFFGVFTCLGILLMVMESRHDHRGGRVAYIHVRSSAFQNNNVLQSRNPPLELAALLSECETLVRNGEEGQAARLLQGKSDSVPDSLRSYLHLRAGQLFIAAGEDSLASAALHKSIEGTKDASEEARFLLDILGGESDTSLAGTVGRIEKFLERQPDFAPAYFRLGLVYQKRMMFRQSLEAYDHALALFPAFKEVRWNRALILSSMEKHLEALAEFETLARMFPGRPEYHFNIARARSRLGNREKALSAYAKAISVKGGDYPEAYFNIAQLHKAMGMRDSAEGALRKALALKGNYSEAWYNLGLLLLENEKLTEAAEGFQHAVASQPDFKEGYFNLGLCQARLDHLDSAISAYTTALRIDPDYAKARIALAIRLDQAGKLSDVVRVYRDGVARDSNNAEFWFGLGLSLKKTDSLDKAIVAYRRAISLDPDDPKSLNNLGLALSADGRREEAIAAFQSGLERFPDHISMRFNLALQYSKLEKKGEALAELAKVARLEPSHFPTHRLTGDIFLEQERPDLALDAYRKALQSDSSPKSYNDLALVLAKQGQRSQAATVLEEGLVKNPDHISMRFNLALQYTRLGRIDSALVVLREVKRRDPEHAPTLRLTGEILLKQGKKKEAHDAYKQAIRLDPGNADAKAALRTLEGG